MKKLLIVALAALTVSAAQAITWTQISDTGVTTGGTNTSAAGSYVYAGNSASIGASIVLTGTIGTGTILSYGRVNGTSGANDSGANAITVSINSDGVYVLTVYNGNNTSASASTTTSTQATAGWHAVAITIERASTGTTLTTVNLIVDGATIATLSDVTIGAGPYGYVAFGQSVRSDDAYNGTADYTVYAAINQVATTADVTTAILIPEPTVLALLALGVAGLALKRRAA